MKKNYILFLGILMFASASVFGQYPPNFTWKKYISDVKDQLRQGPCFTFSAVGGVESMHNLYFGTGPMDLSEREVWSCAPGSIETALQYISSNGVTTAYCIPYPTDACREHDSDNGPYSIVTQPCATLQQQLANCSFKRRVKAGYENVSTGIASGVESIKSILATKGPVMFYIESPHLHQNARHAYVLIGWSTINGQLHWILRDSWPCHPSDLQINASTLNLEGLFAGTGGFQAYVVNQVSEERYDPTAGWYNMNLGIQPFELDPANQIVLIDPPASTCYNEGTYTLNGLNKVSGTLIGWSLRTDYQYYSTATISSTGVLSGNGAGVTVVATIQRPNGLRENITRYVGNVGLPVRINKTADWCPTSGQREIHLSVQAAGTPNTTYTYAMNWPSISNGYVFNYGTWAVFVSMVTQSVNYTVTVTGQRPGCSSITNSFTTYVLALPCGGYGYYRLAAEEEASIPETSVDSDGENFVFPNPATRSLTIRPMNAVENDVTIVNALGNTIYSTRITTPVEVDVSALPRGLYIVELKTQASVSQKRMKRIKVMFE